MKITVKKNQNGMYWYGVYANGILLETFDRKWQAEEAAIRYGKITPTF